MEIKIRPTDNLDAALTAAPMGARIRLQPGLYMTAGRAEKDGTVPLVKSGQTIEGCGPSTVIKLKAPTWVPEVMHGVFVGLYNERYMNVTIRDLLFDLNMQEHDGMACCAVTLNGSENQIINCDAINWGCRTTKKESFIFALGAGWQGASPITYGDHNEIWGCQAFQPIPKSMGGATTVFCIGGGVLSNGQQAVVRNGFISNCEIESDSYMSMVHAFTLSSAEHCEIKNCQATRCEFGVYQDTWKSYDVRIRDNVFKDCKSSMFFLLGGTNNGQMATIDNLWIANNRIVGPGAVNQRGIAIWGAAGASTGLVKFLKCDSNMISAGPAIPPMSALMLYVYGCQHAHVTDNYCELIQNNAYPVAMCNSCGLVEASGNSPKLYNWNTKQDIG